MTSTNSEQTKWRGYAIHDNKKWDEFKVIDFQPKQPGDYDIDVKIAYCGVCGSDVHTLTGGWGDAILPLIVGHEIAGTVVKVGPKVQSIKVGDRVGVGAQVCSCLECENCKSDNENYCPQMLDTYNGKYPNGDIAHGGYSTAIRAHERFVFPIPDGLDLEQVAPLFCAGVTTFSPLKRHGAGPGKTVGIAGVGGLGHYAIQFAKALGADKVVVFSHSANKKEDALSLGADEFVMTTDEKALEAQTGKIDLFLNTADVANKSHGGIPLPTLLKTLRLHGRLIIVGIPDDKFEFGTMELMGNGGMIGATHIGSKKEVLEMLDLVQKKGIKGIIQSYPMKDVAKAVKSVKENTARYRIVLKVDI
ncbi:GroES-like protein [Pterulicium gracile]|uniref:GroES-like protein n=1 Tax=Pterulicium gracile TaxID=1884261 RepID=A0A5C3Q7N7_9AGAR|nr:GroES-like protein [Pterula gracilis]